MLNARVAWLGLVGAFAVSIGLGQGCSGADQTTGDATSSGDGVCGDGIVQGTEQCDDGNTNDNDSCSNSCTLAGCGDGIVQAGEECDDGNDVDDDACANDCSKNNTNCGNAVLDDGEDCDTGGQDTADCDGGDCTLPECGDGYVNNAAGESCEPSELGECPDCGGGAGGGGGNCDDQAIYATMVTNDADPTSPGSGIPSVWSYGGEKGIQAGIDMCQAVGADHVCTYAEVLAADAKGELAGIAQGTEFWVHRVTTPVSKLGGQAGMSMPGPGARCNDWEYPTNHISDGEFGVVDTGLGLDNATEIGNLTIFVDNDSAFTGDPADNHQCGGVTSATAGTPGCAGNCGNATPKAILCCYPQCVQ